MLYLDGKTVKVGDLVTFDNGIEGIVVCSVDDGEYSAEFPQSEWSYLNTGVLVRTKEIGLVHLGNAPSDLQFMGK